MNQTNFDLQALLEKYKDKSTGLNLPSSYQSEEDVENVKKRLPNLQFPEAFPQLQGATGDSSLLGYPDAFKTEKDRDLDNILFNGKDPETQIMLDEIARSKAINKPVAMQGSMPIGNKGGQTPEATKAKQEIQAKAKQALIASGKLTAPNAPQGDADYRSNLLGLGLAEAANKIGSSIAGSKQDNALLDKMRSQVESTEATRLSQNEKKKDREIKVKEMMEKLKDRRADKKTAFNERQRFKDEAAYGRYMQQMADTGRGTMHSRTLLQNIQQADIGLDKIKAIKEGSQTGNYQAALDLSFSISRLISGGVPAYNLVDATTLKSLGGDASKLVQWVKGHPEEYYNNTQLGELEAQFKQIREKKKEQYRDWEKELYGSIGFVLDRQPDLKKLHKETHPEFSEWLKEYNKKRKSGRQDDDKMAKLKEIANNPEHPRYEQAKRILGANQLKMAGR